MFIGAVGFIVYRFVFYNKDGPPAPPPKPLSIDSNTTAFSGRLEYMLNTYYILRDAFVKSNIATVDSSASLFRAGLDSLNMKDIKADTALVHTAQALKESVSTEMQAMVKVKDMEEKRRSFQIISDMLYDLIRTVKYNKQIIYQIHCPMAFNDAGANWLSKTDEIINPYFGNKMLHCGEVVDSIDYRPASVEQKN